MELKYCSIIVMIELFAVVIDYMHCNYHASIMPHCSPPRLYREKGREFDFDLIQKLALAICGNVMAHHTHVGLQMGVQ